MLWFTEVDTSKVWWLANAWRYIWVSLDRVVYGILGLIYQIFFNIASADIFSDNSISRISQRIQLIIGVFVLFQLVMTIIRGIINPDSFTDSKTGVGNVIMRICTALIMLALLVPINFSSTANEYQEKVSQNGILFGTLYSLQYRILNNNTIGQIISGVDPQENESNDEYFERTNEAKLTESANNFIVSILRGFYRINLKEGKLEERDGYEPGMIAANRMCPDGDSFTKYIEKYASPKATPGDIFSGYDASCKVDGNKRYVFTYMPLASLIVGVLFVAIMLGFCYEIAMRAIKLGMLQIIAPIPIISYMDPKGGKDGAFNAWVKLVISTYIDLFIRIATVYFALFIIQEMLVSGVKMTQGGIVGVLTKILIYIALFEFAREAPKFIKQALGMKDEGGGLFSGFSKIAGIGAAGLGAIGAAITSARSSREADVQADNANGTATANRIRNRGKHLLAGIVGGGLAARAGFNAATSAKERRVGAAFDAIAARNAKALAAGRSGGTFFGAVRSDLGQLVTGESNFAALESDWKAREQAIKDRELAIKAEQDVLKRRNEINAHRKNIMNEVKSKTVDNDQTRGSYGGITDANYYYFHSAVEAAKTRGTGVTTDANGVEWFEYNGQQIRYSELDVYDNEIKKANEADFYRQVLNGTITNDTITQEINQYQALSGQQIEANYSGQTGLKAMMGAEDRAISYENDDITHRSQELSQQREAINNERMSYESQRAESNANRFRNGK